MKPMKIKLNEVTESGKQYTFNRSTGELNYDLKDLIGDLPYEADFFIKPLNSKDYEVKGLIRTQTFEQCSLCGDQFKFKTEAKINEILIPGKDEVKNSQFSKSNHVSELNDDGPSVCEYYNDVFMVGEFFHEAIALTVPYNPKPDQNDDGSCKVCLKTLTNELFTYDEKMGVEQKVNPFGSLKNLKLN